MTKKKSMKKIQSKKLEDRIAPGMVGGGLVDPGMVDAVDADTTDQAGQEEIQQTSTESFDQAPEGQEGQYLDEAQAHQGEMFEQDAPESEYEQQDETLSEEVDEFHNDAPEGDMGQHEGWSEPDWVEAQADGSFSATPPEGVTVDPDAGTANFPIEVANEELPLPEGVEITPEGGMEMPLPEGTQYLEASNQLMFPEGEINLEEVPNELEAYPNADGSIMVNLPDQGIEVDMENMSVEVDNYWANEITPENVEISLDGSVEVQLPQDGVEYNDGQIQISAEAAGQMDNPAPEIINDLEFTETAPDGAVTFEPPEGIEVDGGIATMDAEVFNETFSEQTDLQINADGTSEIPLPEGAQYDADINGVVLPEGEINLDEVPEGVDAHINPDGTTTVMLQEGMDFNPDTGSVHMDNYWTNEITPDSVQITAEGNVNIALPEGTEYFDDGSFTVPADHVDFIEAEQPDFVHDVEFSEVGPEGEYTFTPPEGIEVNAEAGEATIPNEMIDEHIPVPEEIHFNADGTMNVDLPEGTQYDTEANAIIFPEGEMNVAEVPENFNPEVNADGTITITLQDGMNYDGDAGQVHFDNYWTNELTPDPIEVTAEGNLVVDLPQDTQFHDDGSFTVPEYQADFLENPAPEYVTEGPDFVNVNPDGSVAIVPQEGLEFNAEAGQMEMNSEFVNEHFEEYIPDDITLHEDGTITAQVPAGTAFDAASNSLTFPAGEMHMDEIPAEMDATLNDDGTISINLQEGMDFNAEEGSVHFDHYWTNAMTPDAITMEYDGSVIVDLPHDTHYFDDGGANIPECSADFIENPGMDYVEQGPEWVNDNPDGSVTITPPEGINVDPATGTVEMSADMAMQELGGDLIPEDFTLNADGTADIKIPEDATFNAELGTIDIPAGSYELTDMPQDIEYHIDAEGTLHAHIPEGVEYNEEGHSLHVSNAALNEMAPEPISIGPEGQFSIDLPEDTQYFDDGSFVISSESADFLDHDGGHPAGEEVDGTYQQAS